MMVILNKLNETTRYFYICRPVVPGGAGGAMAPPDFVRSVNPISTKGARLCPPDNTGTPQFSDLPTVLICTFITPNFKLYLVQVRSSGFHRQYYPGMAEGEKIWGCK